MTTEPSRLTRRGLLAGGVGAAALLGVAGCGGSSSGSGSSSSSAASSASPSATGPRTVRHKYGSTKLTGSPTRVVTLGYTDLEPVMALGVRPIGIVDYFGERPIGGEFPWQRPLWAGHPQPKIVGTRDEYDFERIAGLRPDLIVGLFSGMTHQNYETLSKIAPTVAQPLGHEDFAAPWQEMTRVTGQALGRSQAAERAIGRVEAQYAAVRRKHPQWRSQTIGSVETYKVGQWAVSGAEGAKEQIVADLGFQILPSLRTFDPNGDDKLLSVERLDVVDAENLILLVAKGDQTEADVKQMGVYRKLRAARTGKALFFSFESNPPVGAALAFNSVLSIPYAVRHIVAGIDAE